MWPKCTWHRIAVAKAKDIGFKVSDTEIDDFKTISIYTLWKGRYPVALDIKQQSPSLKTTASMTYPVQQEASTTEQWLR